jgi:diacylglycerol O-acyltransferase / wax synthase
MEQLSAQDASFLYAETPTTPSVGAWLNIYDPSTAHEGTVRFKQILAAYEARLERARYLRARIVRVPMDLDHPYWVDDADFDLEFHVRHLALPKPGDWRQLCIQVARIVARPLDLTRPPWELYVIEGLDNVDGVPPGSFAILDKTHHAAMDGHTGTELHDGMHSLTPDDQRFDPPSSWTPEPMPTEWELLGRAHLNHATMPMRLAETLGRSFAISPLAPETLSALPLVPSPRTAVPHTRFNDPVTPHRVYDGRRLELARLRDARQAVPGATVNDTLLGVVGGALRLYLTEKGELPGEPLVAMAPVSIRDPETQSGGNKVSAIFVPIGTQIGDPIDRLAAIHHATNEQKVMLEAVDARSLVEYAEFVPGGLVSASQRVTAELGLANMRTPFFNTSLTNLPGSQVPQYFLGARLVGWWGVGIATDNTGLFHSAQSYCGTVHLSAISCPKMLPDPAFYADCLQESYDDLVRATSNTRPSRSRSAEKRTTKSSSQSKRARPA